MEKIPLTREEFSEVIGRLQAANELVDRVDELFQVTAGKTWTAIFAMEPVCRSPMSGRWWNCWRS